MHEVTLTGIPGSNPIGAMAAFGLFRICHIEQPFGDCRLSWQLDSDWWPVLHTECEASNDDLTEFLIKRQSARTTNHVVNWNNDIKSAPADFRKQLSSPGTEETKAFFSAFGSEVVTAKSTPDVKPTAFHMSAGKQKFLKSVEDLSKSLDPAFNPSRQQSEDQWKDQLRMSWNEALFGPWMYTDSQHSLGWDPSTERLYALRANNPGGREKPSSVRGAVWLAFESLPLFPCAPTFAGRGSKLVLHTTGFNIESDSDDIEKSEYFTWPVWKYLIAFETLECLLAAPELCGAEKKTSELVHRGCAAVFRTRCLRDGNGKGAFRNARQIV